MISHWFHAEEKSAIRPDRLSRNSLWQQVQFMHEDDVHCSSGDLVIIAFDRLSSRRIKKHLYQFQATPSSALRIVDCGLFIQKSPEVILPVLKEIRDSGAMILLLDPPVTFMKYQVAESRMASIIRESNLDDDVYLRTDGTGPLMQYLGTQRHLIAESNLRIEGHLRLSDLKEDISFAEPCLRDSDVVLFHCDSLCAADAGFLTGMSSSGLTIAEACQLFRYAGGGQSLSSLGIYGYQYEADDKSFTANIIAQMIWYLLEGSMLREDPEKSILTEYVIQSKDSEHSFHFYKSEISGRWWIANRLGRKLPCAYHDYRKACEEDYSGVVLRAVMGY